MGWMACPPPKTKGFLVLALAGALKVNLDASCAGDAAPNGLSAIPLIGALNANTPLLLDMPGLLEVAVAGSWGFCGEKGVWKVKLSEVLNGAGTPEVCVAKLKSFCCGQTSWVAAT